MVQLMEEDVLMRERQLRLAAERKLEIKQKELVEANQKLSSHAISLSSKIVDQRKVVTELEGENTKINDDLERANDQIVQVERLLGNALETIKDGFALFDADHRLITANQVYLRSLNGDAIAPGDHYHDILNLCLDEGLIDLEGQDEDDWYRSMLARWSKPNIEPTTIKLWNGSSIKMTDRRTSEGGIVSMALNITDTIKREAELREARDTALAGDRAKSAFLAKMSHELRTPMNGVVGMADLLLDGELEDENKLYASTIKSSGEALLEIINDVLDFSKIEAEKITLKPKPFDLEQIIQDVSLIVEPAVHQKGLQFDVDYDQFLPTGFVGDAGRVRQILTNLVGNAVKFTEKGHILIRVVGIAAEKPGHHQLNITVEDTGIGIDEDKIEHVFGEFNQVEDMSNRKYEGTGLGLAISRGLIEQMDGEVWVDSIKGQGSCFGFRVILPVATNTPADQLNFHKDLRHILVVSDNAMDSDLLARQLGLLGLNATRSTSTQLGEVKLSSFDLVFLMFDGNDPATVSYARLISTSKPVILVGAASQEDLVEDGNLFLKKPILRQQLAEILLGVEMPPSVEETEPEQDRKIKVLAAEDNKTNQLVFRKMLKNIDIDLQMVENGRLAVEAYESFAPDIVFMDISMPEMDGMDASRNIRAFEQAAGKAAVPIIAMTAHAMAGDEERIRESGIDHYMTKPLKRVQLEEHIKSVSEVTRSAQIPQQVASDPSPARASS